jgi:hypothetical protein
MTMTYYIDSVQLFKGFQIIEGWAFSGKSAAKPGLSYRGVKVDSELTMLDRPDVTVQFADAPLQCGFALRAIVTGIERPEDIELTLATAYEECRIARPGQAALDSAYKPLAVLTENFFFRPCGPRQMGLRWKLALAQAAG